MKADLVSTVVSIVFFVVLSGACVFAMLNSMDKTMKENVQKQLDSNSVGPLDDAMADIAGVPKRSKPKAFVIPNAKPVEINLNF